jgi:hypothetical protein
MKFIPHACRSLVLIVMLVSSSPVGLAADWPTWRSDPGRTAEWTGELADELHLQWVRPLPPLEPAYQNPRLQFDLGYEPVAKDGLLFVGSSRNDSVTAYDAATGEQRWRFHVEGPVRFAPVAWEDRLYFGSDDGFVYCLHAAEGTLVWKFRAVPSMRKVLGNGRLISLWPVRGGPVIADGVLYFAAGVWSFEGVFVYALDAISGEVKWVNDRTGFIYGQHPHDTQAFGGLTPQGYLVVDEDELIVPCGTALPARFDRKTGELKSFQLPSAGRSPGGWFTAAARAKRRGEPVPEEERLVFDTAVNRDRHEGGWHTGPGGEEGARSRVVLNGQAYLFADGYPGVEGTIHTILAAEGRVYVVTREGEIHCFGPERVADAASVGSLKESPSPLRDDAWATTAEQILTSTDVQHGYALVLGIGTGGLIEELVRQSELKLIAVDPDPGRCARLRNRLDELDVLGWRVSVHAGEPAALGLPPYLASLVVSEHLAAVGSELNAEFVADLTRWLRPFGGTACLNLSDRQRAEFVETVEQAELEGVERQRSGEFTLLTRTGPIPGATNYTDGWVSEDEHVKAPLGVLWFDDKLAHFKRAPQPMIVDGVMVSYDKDWLGWVDGDRPPYKLVPPTYSDIYTGRVFSDEESSRLAQVMPQRDLEEKTLEQYRPPTQTNAWSPEPPVIGERINPLTGQKEPRAIHKQYGCDGGIDYGFLYTLRSGTAAFYDKTTESGTIHISGPRSGCTNSVIPAGGILNVPYFFQGCTCSYPLPVGLAMISMPPEHEQWAVWGEGKAESMQRIGINFGAPGARMTEAGTLWLEHPRGNAPAPEVRLSTRPENADVYYRHSVWIEGGTGWPWVAASGSRGLESLTLEGPRKGTYTLRLYFAEPDTIGPGERVFDVAVNGELILENFDIVQKAGGAMRVLVREFEGIHTTGSLKMTFTPKSGEPVLSGFEVIADGLPKDELPVLPDRAIHPVQSPR